MNDTTVGDLIYAAESLFDYERTTLIEIVEAFVAFGLLDIFGNRSGAFSFTAVSAEPRLNEHGVVARLTDKGRFFYEFIWSKPDILYFYALDTPMSKRLAEDDTRYVRACRDFDNLKSIENFYRSSVVTVAVFLLHCRHFNKMEMQALNSKWKKHENEMADIFGDPNTLKARLQLPATFRDFLKLMIRSGLGQRRKDAASEFRVELFGLVNV